MTGLRQRLIRSLANFAGAVIVVFGAVYFIRRSFVHIFDYWQEPVFYLVVVLGSTMAGWLGHNFTVGLKEKPRQRLIAWGSILFSFLYLSCALLCERLAFGTFNSPIWRDLGLLLVLAGWIVRNWAVGTLGLLHSRLVTIQAGHELIDAGPYRRLRHPSYLGLILIFAGSPMVLGTWFPLLALPGVFVAIKWRMDAEEELLQDHFGEAYKTYCAGKWRLLPYVY